MATSYIGCWSYYEQSQAAFIKHIERDVASALRDSNPYSYLAICGVWCE
ncbi:hypothetical protein VCHA50P424_130021 [Vibrio chagasii]|nr:hypothetical protein VCHA50P424_130021 [Vibrio chagasii]